MRLRRADAGKVPLPLSFELADLQSPRELPATHQETSRCFQENSLRYVKLGERPTSPTQVSRGTRPQLLVG